MHFEDIRERYRRPSGQPRLLVIGLPDQWSDAATRDRGGGEPHWLDLCPFEALSAAVVERLNPDIVLSHLLSKSYDVIEVARRLHEVNFNGTYIAIWRRIPNPEVIRNEVRQVAPRLSFELLEISG